MQFGLYAPVPHVTAGSKEIEQSIAGALSPLPASEVDPAFALAKEVLCAADRAGFDIILFAERHLGPDFEAWILAAAVSSWTTRIKTMTAVHPGLWHPTLVAKMAASLDRLTRGRTAINLVTGWNVEEHRMFGGDALVENDDRYIRAEEFVDILRGMWSTSPFTYSGRFYQVDEAQLLLRPATAELPEIFTASRSPRGLDMVARTGDWWFLDYDKSAESAQQVMDSLRQSIEVMNEKAARCGRRIRYAFNPFIAFGDSVGEATERAMRLLASDGSEAEVQKIMARIVKPAMKAGCVGPPGQVRDQLLAYRDMGIELFLFKLVPSKEQIALVHDEIIVPLRGT
ncbi:MAG TPA: LLM class flavin-dependent oxidoreductase, partial [Xanthobacteraceae bacterium]